MAVITSSGAAYSLNTAAATKTKLCSYDCNFTIFVTGVSRVNLCHSHQNSWCLCLTYLRGKRVCVGLAWERHITILLRQFLTPFSSLLWQQAFALLRDIWYQKLCTPNLLDWFFMPLIWILQGTWKNNKVFTVFSGSLWEPVWLLWCWNSRCHLPDIPVDDDDDVITETSKWNFGEETWGRYFEMTLSNKAKKTLIVVCSWQL